MQCKDKMNSRFNITGSGSGSWWRSSEAGCDCLAAATGIKNGKEYFTMPAEEEGILWYF